MIRTAAVWLLMDVREAHGERRTHPGGESCPGCFARDSLLMIELGDAEYTLS